MISYIQLWGIFLYKWIFMPRTAILLWLFIEYVMCVKVIHNKGKEIENIAIYKFIKIITL